MGQILSVKIMHSEPPTAVSGHAPLRSCMRSADTRSGSVKTVRFAGSVEVKEEMFESEELEDLPDGRSSTTSPCVRTRISEFELKQGDGDYTLSEHVKLLGSPTHHAKRVRLFQELRASTWELAVQILSRNAAFGQGFAHEFASAPTTRDYTLEELQVMQRLWGILARWTLNMDLISPSVKKLLQDCLAGVWEGDSDMFDSALKTHEDIFADGLRIQSEREFFELLLADFEKSSIFEGLTEHELRESRYALHTTARKLFVDAIELRKHLLSDETAKYKVITLGPPMLKQELRYRRWRNLAQSVRVFGDTSGDRAREVLQGTAFGALRRTCLITSQGGHHKFRHVDVKAAVFTFRPSPGQAVSLWAAPNWALNARIEMEWARLFGQDNTAPRDSFDVAIDDHLVRVLVSHLDEIAHLCERNTQGFIVDPIACDAGVHAFADEDAPIRFEQDFAHQDPFADSYLGILPAPSFAFEASMPQPTWWQWRLIRQEKYTKYMAREIDEFKASGGETSGFLSSLQSMAVGDGSAPWIHPVYRQACFD